MNDQKDSIEEKARIISSSPLESRHRVVFVMCRNQLLKALNDCSRLGGDEEFKSLPSEKLSEDYLNLSPSEKLELIENIMDNMADVKDTLWAAVVSADIDKRNQPSSEG